MYLISNWFIEMSVSVVICRVTSHLNQQCNRLIDKDCRYEKLKNVLSEAGEVLDQEAAFQCNYTKQDNHDPETNPTAPGQEFHIILLTKLKCNKVTNITTGLSKAQAAQAHYQITRMRVLLSSRTPK